MDTLGSDAGRGQTRVGDFGNPVTLIGDGFGAFDSAQQQVVFRNRLVVGSARRCCGNCNDDAVARRSQFAAGGVRRQAVFKLLVQRKCTCGGEFPGCTCTADIFESLDDLGQVATGDIAHTRTIEGVGARYLVGGAILLAHQVERGGKVSAQAVAGDTE